MPRGRPFKTGEACASIFLHGQHQPRNRNGRGPGPGTESLDPETGNTAQRLLVTHGVGEGAEVCVTEDQTTVTEAAQLYLLLGS